MEEDKEEKEDVVTWIWEIHFDSFIIFESLGTQWRTSFGGVVGLDYSIIPFLFDLYGISKEKRLGIFEDLKIMEKVARDIINEKAKGK